MRKHASRYDDTLVAVIVVCVQHLPIEPPDDGLAPSL